jgi:hypothetical protein
MNAYIQRRFRGGRGLIVSLLPLALAGCHDALGPAPESASTFESTRLLASHAAQQPNVVLAWNEILLEAIRTSPIGPPQAARAMAIVHTAAYDAWAAYDPVAVGTRHGASLRRPAGEHTLGNKEEAISYAMYRALVDLLPARAALFTQFMQSLGYDPANTTTDPTTPAGIGNVAAAAALAYVRDDGANQDGGYADYTGYTPSNTADVVLEPEKWQPLRNPDGSTQSFLVPHWGLVRPFGMTSAAQFRPPPPAPYRSGEYQRQVQEVIDFSAKLTDRHKVIVEYWADGPQSELPPGHWNLFAQVVSRRDGHTLDQDVKLFFALNHALCDASIAAWDAKREYDYVRPITAVRYLKQGKKIRAWAGPYAGTRVIDGESWLPYQVTSFVTPPFAEYVSGHSTFSAAAAEVLRSFTGSDRFDHHTVIPAGSSRIEPGTVPSRPVVLSWPTFTDAADEAGLSRRYGGIHFRQGDLVARAMGREVGRAAWLKANEYFQGSP